MKGYFYQGLIIGATLFAALEIFPMLPAFAQPTIETSRTSKAEELLRIGIEYHQLEQRQKALENYQQALKLYRESGDRKGEASALQLIGAIHSTLNLYAVAIPTYQQALQLYRALQDVRGEASVLNSLGSIYQQQGRYAEAVTAYRQALRLLQQIGDRVGEADTINNLGSLHYAQGQYAHAIDSFQLSLKTFEQVKDEKRLGLTLNNIGLVYTSLGQHSKALGFYQRGVQVQKSVGDLRSLSTTLHNLGFTHAQMEEPLKAIAFYQQALALGRFIGHKSGQAKTLNNLGYTYAKLGRVDQAIKALEQALEIFQAIQERVGEAHTLDSIGTFRRNQGEFSQALAAYQKSLVIWKEVGDPASERITLSNIGKLLEQQNQVELAIVFYKQAVNLTETIRQTLKKLPSDLQESYTATIAETYRSLADLLLQQDRILEAQQVLDLLKVQELEDYLRNVRGNQRTAQGIEVLRPEASILKQYATLQNSVVKLGQELTQLRKTPEKQRTAQQQQRIAQLIALEIELNRQFNEFIDSPAIVEQIAQLSRTARRQTINLEDLNALRDNLRQHNAALLYPLILDDRLELILTTADTPPIRRTVPINRADLNRLITEFRQTVVDVTQNPRKSAQQLYQYLIQPIETDLQQAGIKTIIYAPDGALRYIPLAALYTGDRWLVQDYEINHITARSLTDFTVIPQSRRRILAGAFVQGSYDVQVGDARLALAGLPYAGKEVESLAATIPGTVTLIDQAFGREAVLPILNNYTTIHFATHAAFFNGQPEDSFILFGNGEKVTLPEIQNWSLQNVDLVVLSACQTGLGGFGNGEEVLGFGYQFQRAGARAAIASLWVVHDNSTQVLMNAFYQVLKTPGKKTTAALRQAQLALITGETPLPNPAHRSNKPAQPELPPQPIRPPFAHPYYWAPFILIGNGL